MWSLMPEVEVRMAGRTMAQYRRWVEDIVVMGSWEKLKGGRSREGDVS